MDNLSDILKYTKNMIILYVEDNEAIRVQTSIIFDDIFKKTIIAVDGEDAITKFYENKIDIVISDINMPRVNGLDLVKNIKNFNNNIPVLLYSAHNEVDYFLQAIELNIEGYLLKPLNINVLLKKIESIVNKMKLQDEFNTNLSFLHQYQDLTDSNTAVSKTDLHGLITYVNDKFCKLSGYSKKELLGRSHNIVRHKDTPASEYVDLWHVIKHEKKQWNGILKNRNKNGHIYYADLSIKPILDQDDNIVEYISLKRDITDIMSPNKQLHDFINSANEPIFLMVKIESFADIESFYGYLISQTISDNFAKILHEAVSTYYDFDKFLILENGTYAFVKNVYSITSSFLEDIINNLKVIQRNLNEVSVDAGDITYDVSTLMSMANGIDCIENVKYGFKKLEDSKQDFILSNNLAKEEQKKSQNNLKILKMIKHALDSSNIVSYFQPIVCNKTQKIVKYESLVRLIDEDEKVISPYYFLDIAKKGKYYAQITARVLENSFNAVSLTDKQISINISVLDIEKISTKEKIFELLKVHKDVASRIVFELLEDEGIKDIDLISSFITQVKKYGVQIAIDDFGAGYSNFERLLKYQPDIIKIDGSLIKNIETDQYSLSVVKTIVAFAKEQKIEMIAEYIENENIYHILNDLGVEYSQGYYFGKPDILSNNDNK